LFRKLLVNSALVLGSLVFGLVVVEVGLRMMELNLNEDLPRKPDTQVGWLYEPDESVYFCQPDVRADCIIKRTNNHALRQDDDISFEKEPGVKRVLVLGDSQTAGVIVKNSETYARVLEGLANQNSNNYRYEVINAGVVAYSPVQEWLWFREYGVQYQPDIVLMSFYVGNDLLDMVEIAPAPQPHFKFTDQGTLELQDYPLDLPDESKIGAIESVKRALRPLHLYQLVRYAANNTALAEPLSRVGLVRRTTASHHASRQIPDDQRPQAAAICRGCVLQSLSQSYYLTSLPEQEQLAFEMVKETLQRLKAETTAAKARLIVVLIPTKLQVEPELDEDLFLATSKVLGNVDREVVFDQKVYDNLMEISRQLDVEVLDLLPGMVEFHQNRKDESL
jgi:hypothetical protein